MIGTLILSVPLLALAVWLYLKFCPASTTLRSRIAYELFVLFCEIAGCIATSYYAYQTVGQGVDKAWWPIIALLYSLTLFPIILLAAAILRWFIYRKQ